MSSTRRSFITQTATLGTVAALGATKVLAADAPTVPAKLVHHVFFWLKNPDSKEDLAALLAGIRTLGQIETVKGIHVGVPAGTEKRGVVESSYHASELLYFDDIEGQATYQTHPIHMAFVEKCEHLWSKVMVFDSISA